MIMLDAAEFVEVESCCFGCAEAGGIERGHFACHWSDEVEQASAEGRVLGRSLDGNVWTATIAPRAQAVWIDARIEMLVWSTDQYVVGEPAPEDRRAAVEALLDRAHAARRRFEIRRIDYTACRAACRSALRSIAA